MRTGWKTTEVWVGGLVILFNAIGTQLGWPPFPAEALLALTTWIGGRIAQKTLTQVDANGKRAYQTAEFWAATIFAVAKYVFPSLPEGLIAPVLALIAGRPLIKIFDGFDLKTKITKP